MIKHAAILLLILTVLGEHLYGQKRTGYLEGHLVVLSNSNSDDLLRENITNGAVAQLAISGDTLYTMAYSGMFIFDKIPKGKGTITVSHLNFKTETLDVNVTAKTTVNILLTEKKHGLDEVVIKGKTPLITTSGDTIRFNADAVKLMEGDLALEILKQVPGVVINESGIAVLGENIAKTYVNKRMIFGSGQMTALNNLPASEVLSIDTYEEYANADSTARRKGDEKVRVLNIRTKNPIISAVTGHTLASYGHDFDSEGRNRYGIGATGNFFSEQLLLSVNAFSNNINRRSNRFDDIVSTRSTGSGYSKQDYLDLGVAKNWGTEAYSNIVSLKAGYTYEQSYLQTNNIKQYLYLPTLQYDSREYADTAKSERTNASHNTVYGIRIVKPAIGTVEFSGSYKKFDNSNDVERRNRSSLDGNDVINTSQQNSQQNGYSLNQSLNYSSPTGKNLTYAIKATYGHSNSDGRGFRIDSLASTGLSKVAESGPIGISSTLGLGGTLTYKLSQTKNNNISIGYNFSSDHSRRKRFATDMATLLTDSINTYDYTTDYNIHQGNLGLSFFLWGKVSISPSLSFQSASTNRDENFPEEQNYGRRQNALLPAIVINLSGISPFSSLNVKYNTNTVLPSLEQWRNYLDNRNLYRLVAGNPELKQSYVHSIGSWGIIKGKFSKIIMIFLNLNITQNIIAEKIQYFSQDTQLPNWNNYIAPAQSTLTTYTNLNGMFTGSGSILYNQIVQSIQCMVDINTGFAYGSVPSYIQNTLNKTKNYTPSLSLKLSSNFSKVFRFTVSSSNSYIYSDNTIGQNNKILNFGGSLTTESRFFKYFVFNTSYDMQHYRQLSGSFSNTTHVLNAALGVRLLKGNLELSLAGYDMLNAATRFNTSMQNDYILNTWSDSPGRYFTINIGYKFYKSKSGLTQPKNFPLKDGGVKTQNQD